MASRNIEIKSTDPDGVAKLDEFLRQLRGEHLLDAGKQWKAAYLKDGRRRVLAIECDDKPVVAETPTEVAEPRQ